MAALTPALIANKSQNVSLGCCIYIRIYICVSASAKYGRTGASVYARFLVSRIAEPGFVRLQARKQPAKRSLPSFSKVQLCRHASNFSPTIFRRVCLRPAKMPVSCCSHKIHCKFPQFLGSEVDLNEPVRHYSGRWCIRQPWTCPALSWALITNNSENVRIGTGIGTNNY